MDSEDISEPPRRGPSDRALRVLAVVGVLAAATSLLGSVGALTASNTVPATRGGAGSGTVGGVTNSAFDYALNADTPQDIDAVTFTQAPATAGTVKVEYDGTVHDCTNTAGAISCDLTSPQAVVSVTPTLRVVAVS